MTTERIGNKAPDWGIDYGITDLWSEVTAGLWVGGTHDDDTVHIARAGQITRYAIDVEPAEIGPSQFDAVVTLYAWARPVDWGVEELRWGFMDGRMSSVDTAALAEVVAWGFRRWRAGKRILFRCQAGLNRSSLVAALVLMRAGHTADEAILLIRSGRSDQCLFNTSFVAFLQSSEAEQIARAVA
jgi:hypothetical protein